MTIPPFNFDSDTVMDLIIVKMKKRKNQAQTLFTSYEKVSDAGQQCQTALASLCTPNL